MEFLEDKLAKIHCDNWGHHQWDSTGDWKCQSFHPAYPTSHKKKTFLMTIKKDTPHDGNQKQKSSYRSTKDLVTQILESLKLVHHQRWIKTVEVLQFTHSSHKPWLLFHQLLPANAVKFRKTEVSADVITRMHLLNSKSPGDKYIKLWQIVSSLSTSLPIPLPFIVEGVNKPSHEWKLKDLMMSFQNFLKTLEPRDRNGWQHYSPISIPEGSSWGSGMKLSYIIPLHIIQAHGKSITGNDHSACRPNISLDNTHWGRIPAKTQVRGS